MEVLEMPVQTVSMEVVKLNVTDTEIQKMKDDYLGLTVNGIEDRAGLKKVYESRQIVKKTRVNLVKHADELKEKAIAWQRKVNAEKNRIVSELESIEAHLQGEEDKIAEEKERIRKEEEERENARIQQRIDALAQYGFAIDFNTIKIIDDATFNSVLENAKSEHAKEQARKQEEERLRQEEEARLKAEREELERLRAQQAEAQRIIDEQNARIKKEQEEREEAIRKEQERIENEKRELLKRSTTERMHQLSALGMLFNGSEYFYQDVNVDTSEITALEQDQWTSLVEKITPVIDQKKKEAAEKQQAEIEEAQRRAAEKALREKEEREEAERLAQAEKLAQSSDKVKWVAVIDQLKGISIPEMKSAKAKKLSTGVQEMVNKIITHIETSI